MSPLFTTGPGGEIRTPDPMVPNHVRYQTALHPDIYINGGEGGIRTRAPLTRPNGLANRPLQPT